MGYQGLQRISYDNLEHRLDVFHESMARVPELEGLEGKALQTIYNLAVTVWFNTRGLIKSEIGNTIQIGIFLISYKYLIEPRENGTIHAVFEIVEFSITGSPPPTNDSITPSIWIVYKNGAKYDLSSSLSKLGAYSSNHLFLRRYLSGPSVYIKYSMTDHHRFAVVAALGRLRFGKSSGEHFITVGFASEVHAGTAILQAVVRGAGHVADNDTRWPMARYWALHPQTTALVMGVNGKTSTVELARQLWRMVDQRGASIGTRGVATPVERLVTGLRMPHAVTCLPNIVRLAREGVTHVAYETSSHGFHQYRAEGPPVVAEAVTNLSRNHFVYHGDMANCMTEKLRLFSEVIADDGRTVIWADGGHSMNLIELALGRGLRLRRGEECGGELRIIGFAITQPVQTLTVDCGGTRYAVKLSLIGAYHAANGLMAAGLVIATGGDAASALGNLARLQPARGRLELAVITWTSAPVYVDFAHALEAAIAALRLHAKSHLILVFGADGDRDTGKCAEMGKITEHFLRSGILAAEPDGDEHCGSRRGYAVFEHLLEEANRSAMSAARLSAHGRLGRSENLLVCG